jgi:formylglycine-generating enzyme required for sulfatase activity
MAKSTIFEDDLKQLIADQKVVVVVGSGVSIATTDGAAPSWPALISAAADQCAGLGVSDTWLKRVRGNLEAPVEMDLLLSAAELVHSKLQSKGKGEFSRWLREYLSPLDPCAPRLIKAIAALDAPIVTTNYDDLIEKVTGLKSITWLQETEVSRTLHNAAKQILHLHGHWAQPDSVVLGIRSYEAVCKSHHTQSALKALGMTKSFLFVGCGDDGLNDPDFGSFLTWLREIEKDGEHRHYRLILNSEADRVKQQGRIFPLVYGTKHGDLPRFLERINPNASGKSIRAKAAKKSVTATSAKTSAKTSSSKASSKSTSKLTPARTPAVEAYLRRLTEQTSRLMLLGFGRSLQIELPITEAFVPLQATLSRSMEMKPKERVLDKVADSAEDVELADMFKHAAKLGHRGVVLLGEPGAGKTTGARQLAWQLASGTKSPEDFGLPNDITPVLLKFRSLSRHALEQKNGLRTFLTEQTHCNAAKDGLADPGSDLWNGGSLLWILDGLDEVIDPVARAAVSRWIQEAIRDRTDDSFLVTCRFAGYFREGVVLGPRFVEFHVRRLSDLQVAEFVRRWYDAAYKVLGLSDRSPELPGDRATALLSRLELPEYHAGRMPELRTNPQLLTLLCVVFHDKQKLPDNRAELYAECIMVFLQHWRQEVYESELGKQRPGFDAKAAQSVLAYLANWMHAEQDRISAPIDQLAIQATKALQRVQPEAGLGYDGMAFIDRMKDETGILASDTEGRCGFLHLSFQEYLAANYAVSRREAGLLASLVQQPWWREVCLLSLRQDELFCEEFFRAMLQQDMAEHAPDMADRCLSESLYFSSTPFTEVLQAGKPLSRVAAALRMLRHRTAQVPGLAELLLPLAKSLDSTVNALAGEMLTQLGIAVEVPKMRGNVMFHSPGNITLVRIPAGQFQMCSASNLSNERPTRMVTISQDFLLGRYPVTNAQYGEYLKGAGEKVGKPEYWDDRRFNQPEQPVVGISWSDAQGFCEWAGCRLPTEGEWEYSCRAGTTTAFSFADSADQLDKYGWYDKNSGGQTQPVGTKEANPWGLHDMHGNVWEWCQDWYGEYSAEPVADPSGPKDGYGRVLRGGSWDDVADFCRSSIRYRNLPDNRLNDVGFRVARTL